MGIQKKRRLKKKIKNIGTKLKRIINKDAKNKKMKKNEKKKRIRGVGKRKDTE